MDKSINLYGSGDIKNVSFTNCMELDFKEAYGLDLKCCLHNALYNKKKFNTYVEFLKYDRDVLNPEKIRKIKLNTDMYPPIRLSI